MFNKLEERIKKLKREIVPVYYAVAALYAYLLFLVLRYFFHR